MKEDLQITKERLIKTQKADAQLEIYKTKAGEMSDVMERLNHLEQQNIELEAQNKLMSQD